MPRDKASASPPLWTESLCIIIIIALLIIEQ